MPFALHRFSSHPVHLVTMVQCEGHCTLPLAFRIEPSTSCCQSFDFLIFELMGLCPWTPLGRRPQTQIIQEWFGTGIVLFHVFASLLQDNDFESTFSLSCIEAWRSKEKLHEDRSIPRHLNVGAGCKALDWCGRECRTGGGLGNARDFTDIAYP